ncbi:hypothetical protein BN59_02652 [Legionella massiliensis]|uniref:Uncharacterized protein n=1 Tax=Legionella massiliensis TaxID=1034943 RepID=A0A078KZ70_9GAMM|nr:hypothetical protein BN59_02652 [Legionella massiliensis]CEE14080.1 hypothetical protein BN1094_02652 [Legionella massiliensis]
MSLLVSTLGHPERSEGSPECGTVLIPEILRYALDDVRLLQSLV